MLIETKLWRNAQMRREVVAQTLDYVAALTAMGYEAFETAIRRGQGAPDSLYALVADHSDALEEARFIDAVSANLTRGRVLAIVLSDGIRTETEALADLLQGHAGAHFTFALVELATWQNAATGDIVALPSTLARTVMIERGIVRVEAGTTARIEPVPIAQQAGPSIISLEQFWEHIGERNAGLPVAIRAFLAASEPLGVYPDLKASLNLKVDLPGFDTPLNLGSIRKNGQFRPSELAYKVSASAWHPYSEAIAQMVGGQVIDEPQNKYVAVDGAAICASSNCCPRTTMPGWPRSAK